MDWGEWSQCSATCDTGLRQRKRTKEITELGGVTCTGQPIESELCKEKDCNKIFLHIILKNVNLISSFLSSNFV